MLSNKPHIRNLVEICALKGIEQVIISPGSRNAPLVISFGEHSHFDCISIPDERVAGFFALGIAQQTRKPVIITCTSGTASLNFAPAIAEAFYQKIPLLILTADRPVEWIHQGEGQSVAQRNVFANYVKRSYELPQEVTDPFISIFHLESHCMKKRIIKIVLYQRLLKRLLLKKY